MSKLDLKDGADVTMYLKEVCSVQEPLLEGHGCKDMSKTWLIVVFHRKYFVLYHGVLVYYDHQSGYSHDKKKGLVSEYFLGACEAQLSVSCYLELTFLLNDSA